MAGMLSKSDMWQVCQTQSHVDTAILCRHSYIILEDAYLDHQLKESLFIVRSDWCVWSTHYLSLNKGTDIHVVAWRQTQRWV